MKWISPKKTTATRATACALLLLAGAGGASSADVPPPFRSTHQLNHHVRNQWCRVSNSPHRSDSIQLELIEFTSAHGGRATRQEFNLSGESANLIAEDAASWNAKGSTGVLLGSDRSPVKIELLRDARGFKLIDISGKEKVFHRCLRIAEPKI